jgi:hypothetical protein
MALKAFLTKEKIDYQLVPPGLHRRNAAERAIRTFKNHSSPAFAASTKTSHYIFGTNCYPRPKPS